MLIAGRIGCANAALALILAGAAAAAPPAQLRLVGQTAVAATGVPKRFVIDAQVKPGDAAFQSTVEGWIASLDPEDGPAAELEGSCVEDHCALSADVDEGKLAITGDFPGAGAPGPGRLVLRDGDKTTAQGTVSFTSASGVIPGLGELAAPGSVDADQLIELLVWNGTGSDFGFSDRRGDPVSSFQRDALKDWQAEKGRKGGGLILVADLAELKAGMEAARRAAGWTQIGEPAQGWSAGYPAALLPKATRVGAERRFESADGKARLVIAIEPPLSDEAFRKVWDDIKEERPGRDSSGYARVNDEFQISWKEKGVSTLTLYRNLDGGLARLILSYPEDAESFRQMPAILVHHLRLEEGFKAAK